MTCSEDDGTANSEVTDSYSLNVPSTTLSVRQRGCILAGVPLGDWPITLFDEAFHEEGKVNVGQARGLPTTS